MCRSGSRCVPAWWRSCSHRRRGLRLGGRFLRASTQQRCCRATEVSGQVAAPQGASCLIIWGVPAALLHDKLHFAESMVSLVTDYTKAAAIASIRVLSFCAITLPARHQVTSGQGPLLGCGVVHIERQRFMMGRGCISFRRALICFTGAGGFQRVQPCGSGCRDNHRHALREPHGGSGVRGQARAERRRAASWRAAITSQQVPASWSVTVTCRTVLRCPHDVDAAQLSHRAFHAGPTGAGRGRGVTRTG